jgi:hypothetical protein
MWKLSKVSFSFIVIFAALTLASLALSPTAYGYEGYPSLKIGVGARELAMGSSGVAGAIGANASFFNPALISGYKDFRAHLSYTRWFLDSQRSAAFFVRHLPKFNVGFGLVGFDAGKLEYRDDKPTENPSGYFGAEDITLFGSIAAQLDSKTSGGVSLKFYYEKIYLESAAGFGLDFGLSYRLGPRFNLGFSLTNFSSLLSFKVENFSLPTTARLGCAFTLPVSLPIILTQDLSFLVYSKDLKSSTGVEIGIQKNIFLRAGYRLISQYQERYSIVDATEGLSVGLGLKVKGFGIDYAYLPFGLGLGSTHHFSINLSH